MSSFVEEFKKYQKQERWLTGSIVLVSVFAPIAFTFLIEKKAGWLISGIVGFVFLTAILSVQKMRNQVAEKLIRKYETLDVGAVLAKKITPEKPRRFVITNRGYNHYYLKCLNTGEQVLVPKHRVREDFDIAN